MGRIQKRHCGFTILARYHRLALARKRTELTVPPFPCATANLRHEQPLGQTNLGIGMTPTVVIGIAQLPDRDCFNQTEGEIAAIRHVSQECDSYIDLIINGKNLLSDYLGAFVYPTFAFLRSTTLGICELFNEGKTNIPIFLQQYSFSRQSPCHSLEVKIEDQNPRQARVCFEWYTHIALPPGVPKVNGQLIEMADFTSALGHNIRLFEQRTRDVLLPIVPKASVLLDELFSTLPDVENEWMKYESTVIKRWCYK